MRYRFFLLIIKINTMRVKLGAIVTEASGKIGGQFISSDRSGCSLRTKAVSSTKSETMACSSRSNVQFFSQYWRTLSEVERMLWNNAASIFSSPANVWNQGKMSGLNYFIQVNSVLNTRNSETIVRPPALSFINYPNAVSASYSNEIVVPEIGATFGGGTFAGLLPPSDPIYDPSNPIGLVCSLQTTFPESRMGFPPFNFNPPLSEEISASRANTESIYSKNPESNRTQKLALDYSGGGFTDWAIPSKKAIPFIAKYPETPYLAEYGYYVTSNFQDGNLVYVYQPFSEFMNSQSPWDLHFYRFIRLAQLTAEPSLTIVFDSDLPENCVVRVSASRVLSLGQSNARGRFCVIGEFDSYENNQLNVLDNYIAQFGSNFGSGYKCFLKVEFINLTNAMKSSQSLFSVNF